MDKEFLHEVMTREHFEALGEKGATWDTIRMFYVAPAWCSNELAIPTMQSGVDCGCKKLLTLNIKSQEDCDGCPFKIESD